MICLCLCLNCAQVLAAVKVDVVISPSAPGGKTEYRRSLAASFMFKAFVHVANALEAAQAAGFTSPFPADVKSAAQPYTRPPSTGVQFHAPSPDTALVGQSPRHMSADLQVSGVCFGLILKARSFSASTIPGPLPL